jgi:hypothetical protein
MEEVCERENLKAALRQVKGNKGSAGMDGVTVDQLTDYLKQHWASDPQKTIGLSGIERDCGSKLVARIKASVEVIAGSLWKWLLR